MIRGGVIVSNHRDHSRRLYSRHEDPIPIRGDTACAFEAVLNAVPLADLDLSIRIMSPTIRCPEDIEKLYEK